ncbi:HK97 family phage prohead protease [Pseudonocardia sp. WMMC193]|uniref:HK97 family phage prohead protease n=1 Tax=Pseudonocardia sp. WMMC193 TaxID=2911965 RepID=UPI001F01FB85|nr:HK97 family phage prohead protease [Pseudonocardia sp. WMMC193]MCF7550978.1 HK97 family phage prohead protease [Pseudonocardia sp. WMMC193]
MTVVREFRTQVKAVGDADGLKEGQYRAIVSVFDVEDSWGDVVMPGAFTETLAEWAASGDPLPIIWSHDWRNPFAHLGVVKEAEETEKGLLILGEILDRDTNPTAAHVYGLLKGRRVTQSSFAYDILDSGWATRDGDEVFELRRLKLHEVGPCLLGVNQETELLDVKARTIAAQVKAGRVLSQTNYDRLSAARDSISEVLDAATPLDDDSKSRGAHGRATGRAATDDDPRGGKSAASLSRDPAQLIASIDLTELTLMGESA